MTVPIKPAAASLYGAETWYLVVTVASTALIPTAVEVNAAGSLDVTDMLFADSGIPSQTTNRVSQERRYGDTVVLEAIGAAQFQGAAFHYAFSPQSAAGSDGKKAFEKLGGIAGVSSIFLVNRQAKAKATTPAALDFVNCFRIQVGPSFPSPAGDNESAEAGMTAEFAVLDRAINVQLT